MAVSFRIYGTIEANPNMDEIVELLEESEFEITTESDGDDDDDWSEVLVYEASLEEPISVYRIDEEEGLEDEVENVLKQIKISCNGNGNSGPMKELRHTIENCVAIYGVEVPEEAEDDDNALVLSSLIVQLIAQKCDGVYCVDGEGFFNDAGDLILELVQED